MWAGMESVPPCCIAAKGTAFQSGMGITVKENRPGV